MSEKKKTVFRNKEKKEEKRREQHLQGHKKRRGKIAPVFLPLFLLFKGIPPILLWFFPDNYEKEKKERGKKRVKKESGGEGNGKDTLTDKKAISY